MSKQSCGIIWERELRKELAKLGTVFRVAGSGGASDAYADLVFFPRNRYVCIAHAIECKATHADTFYFDQRTKKQLRDLIIACDDTTLTPILALKFLQKKGRKKKVLFQKLISEKFLVPIPYGDAATMPYSHLTFRSPDD